MRLEPFLAGPVVLPAFKDDDARAGGEIRAILEASDKPIGAYDLLIAGPALARLPLVTANVCEFSRIEGRSWQD
jgi:tRNA(fMet)-specific endonuclease VapC